FITCAHLAGERLLIIRNTLADYVSVNRYEIIMFKLLIAATIILFLALLVWLINKLSSPLLNWVLAKYKSRFKDFYVGSYLLISAADFEKYIAAAYKIVKLLIT